jgi:hypothetical protein
MPGNTHLAHFVLGHGAGNIALVLEDKQACSRETLRLSVDVPTHDAHTNLFLQQPCQLVATVVNPLAIRRIHHPYQRVRLLKVVLPVGAQCLLPADIPCTVSSRSVRANIEQVQYICSVCTYSSQRHVKFCERFPYPSYSIVLMMKPRVGLTLLTSSFMIFFTMVVFPALSSPLMQSAASTANRF